MKILKIAVAGALGLALAGAGAAWADSHNRRSDAHPEQAKPAGKKDSARTTDKQPIVVADSHNRRKKKD